MTTLGNMNLKEIEFRKNFLLGSEIIELGSNPYIYNLLNLSKNEFFDMINIKIKLAVVLLEGEISINGITLKIGELYFGDVTEINIKSISDSRVLISYVNVEKTIEKGQIFQLDEIKRVEKPWGYEIWYTGDPSILFAFKKIFIKKGNKTSLQVHKIKRETNFIVQGDVKLHYVDNFKYEPNKKFDVSSKEFSAPIVIDVFPYTIHRVEALTDLLLYEVSTPELDDVIRLEDDTQRENGRVSAEH